jgi:glycosyltransferase involved in cell wall biosynthesis
MNLGIFLSPGDSFKNMSRTGQSQRFLDLYVKKYSKDFNKVYIFSYEDENLNLPKNVEIVPNKSSFHRILYGIFLPITHRTKVNDCDVIRGFGLASSISCLLLKTPFVFNWAFDYISFVKIEKKFVYMPFYFILEKLAFLKSARVLVATREKFQKLPKRRKFYYLPNGVDLKLFRPQNTKNKKEGVIYIGRLEKQKNLFFLLDSISRLPKSARKITFIGDGSQKEELIKYAKRKRVLLKIIPPQKHLRLPAVLKNYKVFVLTSYAEGSPKVLLEAMASGLVPVVNNFSTARDVVENGKDGFIIDANKKEFSNNIRKLLANNDLLTQISRRAVEKIKKSFNQEVLLKKEIKILKEAAQDK